MSKEYDEFNCSQEHEFTYVKNLYTEPDKVYTWLKEECKPNGKIDNTTHQELYKMLKDAGFTKK